MGYDGAWEAVGGRGWAFWPSDERLPGGSAEEEARDLSELVATGRRLGDPVQ